MNSIKGLRFVGVIVLSVLLLTISIPPSVSSQDDDVGAATVIQPFPGILDEPAIAEFAPNELLVGFDLEQIPSISPAETESIMLSIIEELCGEQALCTQIIKRLDIDTLIVYWLSIVSDHEVPKTVNFFNQKLQQRSLSPEGAFAEPNYIERSHQTIPNDPMFVNQWSLLNVGQLYPALETRNTVGGYDADIGLNLVPFGRNEKHVDVAGGAAGVYDPGERIFLDANGNARVDIGERRLLDGTAVAIGDPDVGLNLVPFGGNEKHVDKPGGAAGVYDPGEEIFLDAKRNARVDVGERRLSDGTIVGGYDLDIGLSLITFKPNEMHTDEPTGAAGVFDADREEKVYRDLGEQIFLDANGNGRVDVGERRLLDGTVVAIRDPDIGLNLVAFGADEKHIDVAGGAATVYDPGEQIFLDANGNGRVDVGERRLLDGTIVAVGDPDIGLNLVAFGANEKHADKLVGTANVYDGRNGRVDVGERSLLDGTIVAIGDPYIGQALVKFAANEKHSEDVAANGQYDTREGIYVSADNRVDAGETRFAKTLGVIDADIDMPQAWDLVQARDCSDVVVAIIGTGLDLTHPDLAGNLWTNPGETAGDGLDNDSNGYTDDIHGVNFVPAEMHTENVNVNGAYDAGEYIYRDHDGDSRVSAGDVRLTNVPASGAPRSVVAAGNPDVGTNLIAFAARERHVDISPDGFYNPGEWIYLDADNNGIVSARDTRRTTIVGAYAANTVVAAADLDLNFHLLDFLADRYGGPPQDRDGHETFVAGIIGAVGNNNQDICGICWGASLMALRTATPTGSMIRNNTIALFLEAMSYIFNMKDAGVNIRVINFSFGANSFVRHAQVSIRNADRKNVLFITAAGNDDRNNDAVGNACYPCNYVQNNIICVAASTHTDKLAGFSNWGRLSVDLAAPGEDIVSLKLGGGTTIGSGTSYAAPHVTGIAAIAFHLFPQLTDTQFKQVILDLAGARASAVHLRHGGTGGIDLLPAFANRTVSDGRLRWPFTADLGDLLPVTYNTLKNNNGALHWDNGNERLGCEVSSENDADNNPIAPRLADLYDPDGLSNVDSAVVPIVFDRDRFDDGGFQFNPPLPWKPNTKVTVFYDICTNYLGVNDAAGGRYQAGNADRSIYVNGYFDWNNDGDFADPREHAFSSSFFPGTPPAFSVPGSNTAVFPSTRRGIAVQSTFTVPGIAGFPTGVKEIKGINVRFRLDYGENVGANNPTPVFERDRTPVTGWQGFARFGEVEDYRFSVPQIIAQSSPIPNEHNWNNTNVKVTLQAEALGRGSRILAIYYTLNGKKKIEILGDRLRLSEAGRVATYKLAISVEGVHKLVFWAEDLTGNKSDPVTLTIKIDKTPPVVQLTFDDILYTGTCKINWKVSDTMSGVASCQFYVNDCEFSSKSSGSWPVAPGLYKVRVEAKDRAGNRTSSSREHVVTPPPAHFRVSKLSVLPNRPGIAETVRICCTVKNTGEKSGSQSIALYVEGSCQGIQMLTLAPGESKEVSFTYVFHNSGSYDVKVKSDDDSESRTVTVLSLPKLEVSRQAIDFGKVEVGSSASRYFTITNRGDAELKGSIQCSSGNCGAFSFSPSSFSLGKQETSRITVRFSPSQEETYRAVIGIESNGGNTSVTLEGGAIQWSSYLSDIQESSVQVGWGSFHKDMFSKRGETRAFILDGKTYQKGLDTHAPAHVIYNLNGQFKRFQSFVGLWDSGNPDRGVPGDPAETRGSVRFIVVLDGQQVYDSGVMRWDTPAKSIDIDVSGAQILELRVMDVEDLAYDWSIWADAKLLK